MSVHVSKGNNTSEDITIVNIYSPNVGAPSYIKQTLLDIKGQAGPKTIRVGDFNMPLSSMDRSYTYTHTHTHTHTQINKGTSELNCTIDQINLTDIYKIFHPTTAQYTLFAIVHQILLKTEHNEEYI
jgi:exonuclease III